MIEEDQLLLPYDCFKEKEQKKKVEVPYFENPKNDNERLLNCQYEYYNGDPAALTRMYQISLDVCSAYIGEIAKANQHVLSLPFSKKKEKAHDAATYLPARYLKKKDFVIKTSFTGYLFLRVQYEVYKDKKRKVDQIVDFVDFDEFFKEDEDYGDEWE